MWGDVWGMEKCEGVEKCGQSVGSVLRSGET